MYKTQRNLMAPNFDTELGKFQAVYNGFATR